MTDAELTRLEELARAATTGPWTMHGRTICAGADGVPAPRTGMRPAGDPFPVLMRFAADYQADHDNAAAIVATHNALPALIAEVRRLRAENERLEVELDGLENGPV